MSFKVSDNKLLKKYTKIWERVSNLLSVKFDNEPVCGDNDKYIKTKTKIYEDRVNTNFQGKKNAKRNASNKFLSFIMPDSVIRANKKYYWTQGFSREGPINSALSICSSVTLISQDPHARSF